uniref:Maturase n=1 Tax=virus sp. ctx9V1 TaxID=2828001 RepID=A0A8S5RDA3_9VIRU|nr:MAG TPA: maturase [virus sp. ctx9V1]
MIVRIYLNISVFIFLITIISSCNNICTTCFYRASKW